ncbi:MAG: methylmalonyl Co-A mutase-associated GTPase MeaB [Bacteroidia bacterium]|nr:methylmalonyl Co-A mutase-associated GTPase MeaB [Bacteroidia bacterium]MDG2041249.1 methylmalonyl Co-A mutase-associated GTPase MeaB [Bacteroidia bacterium]|tara:strand:- start:26529 stop:27464 length:936 start_codon:yes stop_codon:yes gene_type:complete
MTKEELIKGIRKGDSRSLSKAITLAESSLESKQELALQVIEHFGPQKSTLRVGITGAPGVGKSTFIESVGLRFLQDPTRKIAVLSVDPSSEISQGSILGDKTRMNQLSSIDGVYIRPSASGNNLGGVAKNTRLAILLCEAAGYNTILIESVGVGQNETEIAKLSDLFVLLISPGGGDELQGIKRGIMEVADIIVVNKADGNNKNQAQITAKEYSMALNLKPKSKNQWIPKIIVASAYEKNGIQPFIEKCLDFDDHVREKWKHLHRKEQMKYWAKKNIQYLLLSKIDQYNNKINSNIENGVLPERLARDILE